MTRTRSYTLDSIYKYIRLYVFIHCSIFIGMPVKLKPSTKEYTRNAQGRMTNKWKWKHYTVSNTKTEELLKLYKSLPRKKNVIAIELDRRGVDYS